ncbi:serine/arginine repetitive matrix protein 2 [Senna tora]|uniref:Serine/arginine repetitive matrix protein 2 n=1 Tax=Senna tora TaxID=362788 RepID=A0A834SVJ8_9FABA|nr:serine/arginine repetitive matrix protein 2 [Senna tora]
MGPTSGKRCQKHELAVEAAYAEFSHIHMIDIHTRLLYLSDTDESAIDEIISQAQDACVLEQVSAINCSSFTHSVLPTDLESRFRRLKSFPVTTKSNHNSKTLQDNSLKPKSQSLDSSSDATTQTPQSSPSKENQMDRETKLRSRSSNSSPLRKKEVKPKSKSASVSSPSNSSKDRSPSPPRGCFWCSPKKKSKENWGSANFVGLDPNGDELLSDLGSFSSKHQQKLLKKAIKEQEKINREAEKIVQWAKQASKRMSALDMEDDLSDD